VTQFNIIGVTQFNITGVMQSTVVGDDFCQIMSISDDIGCRVSPSAIPRRNMKLVDIANETVS
jgi:hypothetical protein